MPADFPWFYAALILAAVGWTVPGTLRHLGRAFVWTVGVFWAAAAGAIVREMEAQLSPHWAADFDEALEEALKPIMAEMTTNGGASLKDKVDTTALTVVQIQRDIEPLLVEYRRRYDPPEGSPA